MTETAPEMYRIRLGIAHIPDIERQELNSTEINALPHFLPMLGARGSASSSTLDYNRSGRECSWSCVVAAFHFNYVRLSITNFSSVIETQIILFLHARLIWKLCYFGSSPFSSSMTHCSDGAMKSNRHRHTTGHGKPSQIILQPVNYGLSSKLWFLPLQRLDGNGTPTRQTHLG